MRKKILLLIALSAVIIFSLASCLERNSKKQPNETDDNLVISNDIENLEQSSSDDLSVKEDTLDKTEVTQKDEPIDSASVENNTNVSKPDSAQDDKPVSDSNKTETVKPDSTPSKSETTSSKPSSTSKPTETKPNNSGSSTNNQPSGSSTSNKTEQKPAHSHQWKETYRTVSHKEERQDVWVVDSPAYTEEVPVYVQIPKTVCNTCRTVITSEDIDNGHVKAHALAGETKVGWHTEVFREQTGTEIIEHEEEGHWESVVIKEAYTEQVLTGYQCECGETKSL